MWCDVIFSCVDRYMYHYRINFISFILTEKYNLYIYIRREKYNDSSIKYIYETDIGLNSKYITIRTSKQDINNNNYNINNIYKTTHVYYNTKQQHHYI